MSIDEKFYTQIGIKAVIDKCKAEINEIEAEIDSLVSVLRGRATMCRKQIREAQDVCKHPVKERSSVWSKSGDPSWYECKCLDCGLIWREEIGEVPK